MIEDRTIYIGNKPTMTYVLVTAARFKEGDPMVIIKGRGKFISKAVDVSLIVKDRFVPDVQIQNVGIVTEVMSTDQNRSSNVSSIQISLFKSGQDGHV